MLTLENLKKMVLIITTTIGCVFIIPLVKGMEVPRNALLIAGAVSRLPVQRGNGQYDTAISLYNTSRAYSSVEVCAASIMMHIVNHTNTTTDAFLHTWSFDLESRLRKAWNLTDAVFEDNRILEARFKGKYPTVSWAEVSYTLSVQTAVKLMLRHEVKHGFKYDRVILVRPDLFVHKNLDIAALGRSTTGVVFCNSHGKGDGDFHFVMEHWHAEHLLLALQPHPSGKVFVLGNHGNFRRFVQLVLNGTVQNDKQLYPGIHEEVYRKVPFHMMLCNAAVWWREHMAKHYGMNADDWAEYEKMSLTFRKCRSYEPAHLLNYCCRGGSCSEITELNGGERSCGKRIT